MSSGCNQKPARERMAGDEKPKQDWPAYLLGSREVWVYFVMQIELRMQIRQGP